MKKYFCTLIFALLSVSVAAEMMKFVTVLAQPAGTFAQVEVTDSTQAAKFSSLNFCTAKINSGRIETNGVTINNMLSTTTNATLDKDGGTINSPRLTIGQTAGQNIKFTGGALEATNAAADKIKVDETTEITGAFNTRTASLVNEMEINNKAHFSGGGGTGLTMGWEKVKYTDCKTNKHGTDDACNALLLIGKEGTGTGTGTGTGQLEWQFDSFGSEQLASCDRCDTISPKCPQLPNSCSTSGDICYDDCVADTGGYEQYNGTVCYVSYSIYTCR